MCTPLRHSVGKRDKGLGDCVVTLFFHFRYELPAPSSGQKNDITAWQECVNNSMAQLEHQAVRIENLELMSQHGCNAWKVYNE